MRPIQFFRSHQITEEREVALGNMVEIEKEVLWGDIFRADLGIPYGAEQGGVRPVLVVQNDVGNKHSPTTQIIPITSKGKPYLPTHVLIGTESGLPMESIALAEQLRTVDKHRLLYKMGRIDQSKLSSIVRAIAVSTNAYCA